MFTTRATASVYFHAQVVFVYLL